MPELAARDASAPTVLTRDAWNQLLRALDPDAAQAASRYEQLRRHLISLYRVHGLPCPEDLADQALDHVAWRLARGALGEADLAPYLRGVAQQIADDAGRQRRRERGPDPSSLPQIPAWLDDDPLSRLCRCLDTLPRSERRTLLEYETGIGYDRIRRRKALAAELGIPMNALRVRVHRLRARVTQMMRTDDAGLTS
jgi:DNA-directed RNA polymerase specialized sigma24 family protein